MVDLIRKTANSNQGGEVSTEAQNLPGDKTFDEPIQGQIQSVAYNLLINSAFDFWQRGTTSGGLVGSGWSDYLGPDRYWMELRGSGADGSWDRSTDVPDNRFKYSLLNTGGESSDDLYTYQRIEADNIRPFIGKTITFSIYLKSSVSKTTQLNIYTPSSVTEDDWGADVATGGALEFQKIVTPVTGIWERHDITFTVPSTAGNGLMVGWTQFDFDNGETYHQTGWMLHEGDTAVDFQRAGRNTADELNMCQRYYYKHGNKTNGDFEVIANLVVFSDTVALGGFKFPVEMASIPSLTSGGSHRVFTPGAIAVTNISNWAGSFSSQSFELTINVASGLTGKTFCLLQNNNDATAYIAFDAEL